MKRTPMKGSVDQKQGSDFVGKHDYVKKISKRAHNNKDQTYLSEASPAGARQQLIWRNLKGATERYNRSIWI